MKRHEPNISASSTAEACRTSSNSTTINLLKLPKMWTVLMRMEKRLTVLPLVPESTRRNIQHLNDNRKTPLISTYVFSGLATEQVLIFGAVLTFGGYHDGVKNPARKESVQSSTFRTQHAVVHVSAIMHILPGYRGTYNRGYVLSGHCNRQ